VRVSLLLPLVFLALGACVTESARPPQATTTTYVVPPSTTTTTTVPRTY
jgi:hypothetical protein